MEIKILGTGCPNCRTLEKLANKAIKELNLEASVLKEEDIMKIMQYGVMSTPAMVINEKVVLTGKIPSLLELKSLIFQNK